MPMNKSKYPLNWKRISLEVRERAGQCCEACGVANHTLICRSKTDPVRYIAYDDIADDWYIPLPDGGRVYESEDGREFDSAQFDRTKKTRVVLTVHHIGCPHPDGRAGDPRDKMDVRPENLTALCQRCHLLADLDHHMQNARRTRATKRHARAQAAGQPPLFPEGE